MRFALKLEKRKNRPQKMKRFISTPWRAFIGGGILLAIAVSTLFGSIFSSASARSTDSTDAEASNEEEAIFSWVTPEKEIKSAIPSSVPFDLESAESNGNAENFSSESFADEGTSEFQMIPPGPEQVVTKLNALENSWGRFAPGSWVRMRKTVTVFNPKRRTRTITEVKQTLKEIQENGFVLQRNITVLTGALNLAKKPETITFNFYNMAVDTQMTEMELAPDNILISLRAVPCQVREFRKMTSLRREETRIWYSPVLFPYVFRQESTIFTLPTEESPNERLFRKSVTEISMKSPNFRFGNVKRWMTRTVESDENGQQVKQITTLHSNQIPGGILGEVAVEKNPDGSMSSRSESRLLDYYVSPR